MKKLIESFFHKFMLLKRIKDLENLNSKRQKDIDQLRLITLSQTTVISHLVKVYHDMYKTLEKLSYIHTKDTSDISYSEADIDQIYENFISNYTPDDDLLN